MSEYIIRETTHPLATSQDVVGELVRCKDCKYGIEWDGRLGCEWHGFYKTEPEWFCADGDRREDAEAH